MTSLLTEEEQAKIAAFFAARQIPAGLGDEHAACSIAGINLALFGRLTDEIPECMSPVIGRWILRIQDYMPSEMRNSVAWRSLLPLAAGTGRLQERERFDIVMDWLRTVVFPLAGSLPRTAAEAAASRAAKGGGTIFTGACRFCHCTEHNACKLPDGDPCAWFYARPQCMHQPGLHPGVLCRAAEGPPGRRAGASASSAAGLAAAAAQMIETIFTGACQFCHCTEHNACKLPDGDPCAWFTRARNVCTNPACIRAFYAERQRAHLAAEQARPKKRTPADVHALIKRERAARRKQGRRERKSA